MYHHGLVKMLTIAELGKENESWGYFIAQNKFGGPYEEVVTENQEEHGAENIKNNYDEDLDSPGVEGFISIQRRS